MASRCGGPSMALKQWAWDTAAQKLDNSGDDGARLALKSRECENARASLVNTQISKQRRSLGENRLCTLIENYQSAIS